jgi:DNA-binding MarR family transcriptional regulator
MNSLDLPASFIVLTHKYKSVVIKALREAGLEIAPMHIRSLHTINSLAVCTANDLVELMDRDKGQIARLVKEMIEKGFVARVQNPDDKRSQFIEITAFGHETLKQMLAIEAKIIDKMRDSISDDQVQVFNELGFVMTENLKSLNKT